MCCVCMTYSNVLALSTTKPTSLYNTQLHVVKPQYQEAVLLMVALPSMLDKKREMTFPSSRSFMMHNPNFFCY